MKRTFLLPLFSPIVALVLLFIQIGVAYWIRLVIGPYSTDANIVLEAGTYISYFFSFVMIARVSSEHLCTPRKYTFVAVTFLWAVALFREMGAQHWLTKHDTTAIKMRFFTNPTNPLSEKIIVAALLLFLIAVVLYLLHKHYRQMIIGFLKFDPFFWTLATFGGLGLLTQFADRFPANYAKHYGERMSEPMVFACKLLEECGELLLPILFIIALWQLHLQLANKNEATESSPV